MSWAYSFYTNQNNVVRFKEIRAVYIRKQYQKKQTITWVVQLVVDIAYRGKGIASRILQSIWGFSDDFAWGLATTNPCTIKALENAT